jgi:hypothetical protein
MKSLALATALTLLAAPASACGTGGFIQVGNQVACIRAATAEEMAAHRQLVHERAMRQQAQEAAAARAQRSQDIGGHVDRAEREMDAAADNILRPGGRQAYRDALETYIDLKVEQRQLQRGY